MKLKTRRIQKLIEAHSRFRTVAVHVYCHIYSGIIYNSLEAESWKDHVGSTFVILNRNQFFLCKIVSIFQVSKAAFAPKLVKNNII